MFERQNNYIMRRLTWITVCLILMAIEAGPGLRAEGAGNLSSSQLSTEQLEDEILALKRQADDVLVLARRDNIQARSKVSVIFELVDLLSEANRQDEAFEYMEEALRMFPWELKYQMRYGELLASQGKTEEAKAKAELVAQYAESDDLLNRAGILLGETLAPPLPPLSKVGMGEPVVVLVALGDETSAAVLRELKAKLETILPVPIYLMDAQVEMPKPDRNPYQELLKDMRNTLAQRMSQDEKIKTFLKEQGVGWKELTGEETLIKAYRLIAKAGGGDSALKQVDDIVRTAKSMPPQWEIGDFKLLLSEKIKPFVQDQAYFIGVTSVDCHSGESNFIFSTAHSSGFGVASYARFSPLFYQNPPNRDKLVERTAKNILGTLGGLLRVDGCTDPTCVRSYPHNLPEHDAKLFHFCPACQASIEKTLGKPLKTP